MRIILPQPQLLQGLQVVERAINDRSALPILANILIETKGQELVLVATDLDIGVRHTTQLIETAEPGAVTVPTRRLTTIVRELPEEPITIEAKDNHTTILTCHTSRFRIPGLPAEDFPVFPPTNHTEAALTIPQPILKALIRQTAFAMSLEETRFVLNGVLLKAQNGNVVVVATDGRRLALASSHEAKTTGDPIHVIVPSKTIRELSRILREDDEAPVDLMLLKDNQLIFQFGAVTISSRLIDGQFPQYESAIPAPSPTTLTCDRALLSGAIRRVSLMTTATSQAVLFELDRERLVISKETAELGSAREELPATFTGEPMTVAFNPEFWLDVLKALDTEQVTIEMGSQEKPAVVRPPAAGQSEQTGPPQLLYLVLPMKVS